MRHFITAATVICVALIINGKALADFDYGANSSLALSIYNPDTGVETGYDLGYIGTDLDLDAQGSLGVVDVSDLDATMALYSATNDWQFFFGLTKNMEPTLAGGIIGFQNAVRDVFNIGYTENEVKLDSPASIAASDFKSANSIFKDLGNYHGAFIGGEPRLQPSLAGLAEGDDFVFIFLYHFNGMDIVKGNGGTTNFRSVIGIDSTGNVTLNPDNDPPVIDTISVDQDSVAPGETITLEVFVSDETASLLTYNWTGTIGGQEYTLTGNPITLSIPAEAGGEKVTFSVAADDSVNNPVTDSVTFTITGDDSVPSIVPIINLLLLN
jgi:hypothetical protein